MYEAGEFETLTLDEYIDILGKCVERLDKRIVIHRLTGDPPKRLMIAPTWSADKKRVLNSINREFARKNIVQGRLAENDSENCGKD